MPADPLAPLQAIFRVPEKLSSVLGSIPLRTLTIDGALELIRAVRVEIGLDQDGVTISNTGEFRKLPQELSDQYEPWVLEHTGEHSEPKVSLRSIDNGPHLTDHLSFVLDETEWAEVQPLHEALKARQINISPHVVAWVSERHAPLPNILGIHGVVQTNDKKLIIAQRSRNTRYHPLHWSFSFEEQLMPSDLRFGHTAFHVAAARGINEEFLFDGAVSPAACRLLSVILEHQILNPALVVHVEIPYTSQQVLDIFQGSLDVKEPEIDARGLQFVAMDIGSLANLALSQEFPGPSESSSRKWHPTSRYRVVLEMLHLYGTKATTSVLSSHPGSHT